MIWVKRISLALLALILFILVTVAILLYTSTGVKLIIWGAQKALPELSVTSSSGALLNGFQLNQVKYRDQQMNLAADNVNFKLDDRCLLIPEVCISELGLTGIRFNLPELPPSQPVQEEPESAPIAEVIMPLPLRIEHVRLDDVNLDILGNKITWQQFTTAAEMEGSHLVLKPTDWQGIELTLAEAAKIDQTQPKEAETPSSETMGLPDIAVLPELKLPISLDIQRFTVKDFKLNSDSPQQIHLLELIASAEGSNIKIRKLVADAPQAKFQASANVSLTGDYPLSLDANADIAMTPLQDHHITLDASGSLAKLTLAANLQGTLDALITGQLSPLAPNLPFDFHVSSDHLQWPIDTEPEFEVTDTLVNAKGNLNDFIFTLKSSIDGIPMPAAALSLNGKGDLNKVMLDTLKIDTLGGTITGNADASWKDAVTWQGQLDFSQIQPGLEWPEAEGDLSGGLSTSGGLNKQGGWYITLPKLAIDGVVMKQPFTLDGQLDAKDVKGTGDIQLVTKGLTLKHGLNGLTAKGTLNKVWDMTAKIDAPDLALSVPGMRGHAQGQVDLAGKLTEPEINLSLTGDSLGWQDQANLQSFELKGQVTPMPVLKADINLSAAQGEFDTFKLDNMHLSLRGTESEHLLTLDIKAKPVGAEIILAGRLDRKTGWQGRLDRAEFDTQIGLWKLAQPTILGYSLKTESASVAAHCWRQSESSLCLTENLTAGRSGNATLAVDRFTFNNLEQLMPESLKVKGSLDAVLEAAWAPETSPYVKAKITLPTGSVAQLPVTDKPPLTIGWDNATVNAEIKNDVLNANWLIAVTDNGDISGKALITQLTTEQQLIADVKIDKFMLGVFKPAIKDYHEFDGQVDADLTVTGPIMHPAINGQLQMTKIKAIGREVPLDIEQADIRATFSGYSATLKGDLFTPDGKLQLRGDGDWQDLKNWKTQLRVNGTELEIHAPPMLALKVSPDLTIAASPKKAAITGSVAIPWGRIKIDQLPESAVAVSDDEILLTDDLQPIEVKQKIPFDLKTNITVKIGDDVKLSAFGLNTELIGELNVRQKNRSPLVYGEVNLQNGTYRSFAQELIIRKGQILFNGPADQPYLSVEAIRNPNNIEDDVVAGLRVSGPADAPQVDVFSDPAMAQQNALSYLLRGKDLDSESGDNNSAMTTALISMGIAKSGQLVGDVGEAFGIEELTLDTAGAGEESQVTIGGYISPDLQVKYGVGIFNSIGEFTVRYRLMKDLYIEAVSGLDSAVDLLYQFEFD